MSNNLDFLINLNPIYRKELEKKKEILVKNQSLYKLYVDLVVGNFVTADIFWKIHFISSERNNCIRK